MKLRHAFVPGIALLALLVANGARAADPVKPAADKTKCDLTFSLKEWSAVVSHATGSGQVTCENGQSANVTVESKGGGLTAGKFRIDGKGEFSKVHDIADVFGSYAGAEGSAGLIKAGETAVLTKGDVTLGIAGHGEGWNVGISLGKMTITRQ